MDFESCAKRYQLYFPDNELKDVIFSFKFDIDGSGLFILESVKFVHHFLFCFKKLLLLFLSFVFLVILKILDKIVIIEKT